MHFFFRIHMYFHAFIWHHIDLMTTLQCHNFKWKYFFSLLFFLNKSFLHTVTILSLPDKLGSSVVKMAALKEMSESDLAPELAGLQKISLSELHPSSTLLNRYVMVSVFGISSSSLFIAHFIPAVKLAISFRWWP